MTLQEARVDHRDRVYDVEVPSLDQWDTTIDLGRFERLSEAERRRIIIRVLCGLVAMEEAPEPAREPLVAPTPGPARTLPLLGLETAAKKRHMRPRGWSTALLPHLGPERAF
jgi:hypothetical protein